MEGGGEGLVVTSRFCHAGAGVCKVLLYIEPVVCVCVGFI